jgi:sulfane dehydrogenase subunit SoxC
MNPSAPQPERTWPSRRRFLKHGIALGAALTAGRAAPAHTQSPPAPDDPARVVGGPMLPYGERSRFEEGLREKGPPSMPDEWGGNFTPLEKMLGIITPSALHYEVCRGGFPTSTPRSIAC